MLLLLSVKNFSQAIENTAPALDTLPQSTKNLSLYFKSKIPKTLLKNITYPNKEGTIIIYFYINNEGNPFKISTNSYRNAQLNKALIKAFEKYPFTDRFLNFKTTNKYSFQVISKKENSINCGAFFTKTSTPICTSCSDLNFYVDIEKCIEKKIKNYFFKNIDYTLANKLPDNEEKILLNIELNIDKTGTLKLKNLKSPTIFKEHIKNIIANYSTIFTPSLVNNKPIDYTCNFTIAFKKGDVPTLKENEVYFDAVFKPTSTNDFALYLSKNLTKEDIKSANLNRLNSRLSIYFELNKKGKISEIKTTSRSKKLEKKIISLFKKYDIKKLNFVDKHSLNRYFTSVIIYEEHKNKIKTNSIIGYSRGAIFKGCEKETTVANARNCFSRQVQLYFMRKFNPRIANKLGLSTGRKRIFIGFKIDKTGKITDIECRAPHNKIKKEVIRVMKKLPKAQPAVFGRKIKNIKYSIPFTIIVE